MKAFLATALLVLSVPALVAAYDPLTADKAGVEQKDLTVKDAKRTRDIPIRVYLPKDKGSAPVVLFSHGLGGSREMGPYLGNHWAARGYVAVFLQHPGSDDSVWKAQEGMAEKMAALKKAANAENLLLRLGDVPAVLDQLDVWCKESGHVLAGRLDLKRVGMSGHSFGAMTTQGVSGQTPALGKSFTDPRIKAAVIMSPHAPERGDAKKAFADVKIPWLLLTGTKDAAKILGKNDAQFRLDVFPALPPGSKYELVMKDAEHSAFTDRPLPGDREKRNPNHHRAILATSTALWDAYLRDDAEARKWIDGDKVRDVLEKDDRWQKK